MIERGALGTDFDAWVLKLCVNSTRIGLVVAIEVDVWVICVRDKILRDVFAESILGIKCLASWAVFTIESFKVEVSWKGTGYAGRSIVIRGVCFTSQ